MENTNRYPQLEIDLAALTHNAQTVIDRCREKGIDVAAVVKGTHAIPACVKAMASPKPAQIASSRIEQLASIRDLGLGLPLMLIRIPMISEVDRVVDICEYSLHSEPAVLTALNQAAEKAGKSHQVILMADLGDLREGFWEEADLVAAALLVERELPHLHLAGVGTNLGCYGSILATEEKLEELVARAEAVEQAIGRPLEILSGGATSSYMRVRDGDIPARINHLRIGEEILNARDLEVFYGYDQTHMEQQVYTLLAEVVEVKDKPTHPVGTIAVDAFGHRPRYVDRGIRRRAIAAVGKVDVGDLTDLFPRDKGIRVLGGSSDHAILDVEDAQRPVQVGDILAFGVDYGSMVFLTSSPSVQLAFR